MEYVELDNLSDEAILSLYDDVIAWTITTCDGTGAENYTGAYYGPANRYGYTEVFHRKGACEGSGYIFCYNIDCCESNAKCSTGFSLKYSVYSQYFQEEL